MSRVHAERSTGEQQKTRTCIRHRFFCSGMSVLARGPLHAQRGMSLRLVFVILVLPGLACVLTLAPMHMHSLTGRLSRAIKRNQVRVAIKCATKCALKCKLAPFLHFHGASNSPLTATLTRIRFDDPLMRSFSSALYFVFRITSGDAHATGPRAVPEARPGSPDILHLIADAPRFGQGLFQ